MEKSQLMRHSADTVDAVLENVRSIPLRTALTAIEDGTYGYKIYVGGRWGKKVSKGRALSKIFTSREEALDVVEKAILFFRDHGNKGERFAETIERIGFENVEKELIG